MMHQLEHWPEAFDEALWPFAFEHAVCVWNNLPRHHSGLTPLELFTGLRDFREDNLISTHKGIEILNQPALVKISEFG